MQLPGICLPQSVVALDKFGGCLGEQGLILIQLSSKNDNVSIMLGLARRIPPVLDSHDTINNEKNFKNVLFGFSIGTGAYLSLST